MNFEPHAYSAEARAEARARWDGVAKPLRSLGRFEDIIVQIAGIQGTADVTLSPRCALVFCGDHGVVEEGVTQSGSEVTAMVARALVDGVSNVNLLANRCGAEVFPVDMGMAESVAGMIDRRVAPGTANMARHPAMTRAQAEQAVRAGAELVGDMKERGFRMAAVGEMGIGNTTASAAMVCALLSLPPEKVVGRGAGLSDEGLARKTDAVRRALALHHPDPADPLDVLAKVGGFELAGMTGAFLGGMVHGVPMVIDGVISAVAALTAARLRPAVRDFLLPSHLSREPAARYVFDALDVSPVLDAGLALGEGTGAVLLFPLLDAALAVYAGPHTFRNIGLAPYQPQEGMS